MIVNEHLRVLSICLHHICYGHSNVKVCLLKQILGGFVCITETMTVNKGEQGVVWLLFGFVLHCPVPHNTELFL